MRKYFRLLPLLALALMVSCGDDDEKSGEKGSGNGSGGDSYVAQNYAVKGQVEKGPFVSGSVINMQPLNEKMQAVGSTYTATITDDQGSYAFNPEQFEEPFARMSVSGYFFNEYTGKLSAGQITLQSVVDLHDKSSVNVNLLTHLKYQRVLNLVGQGMTYAEANGQAQQELLTAFGLAKLNTSDASQFSVAAGTDESAALIYISSLLLYNRGEAEFTEYLARLSAEFAQNGSFSEASKKQMEKDRDKLGNMLKTVSKNLIERYKSLGRTITVKPLENYVDWDGNGIAGDEIYDPSKPVVLSQKTVSVPKEGGVYTVTYESSIPVLFSPKVGSFIDVMPSISTLLASTAASYQKTMEGNKITLTVAKNGTKNVLMGSVTLYDYVGNKVGTIAITQDADPEGSFLNSYGEKMVDEMMTGLCMEQYDGVANIAMNGVRMSYGDAVYHLQEAFFVYKTFADVMMRNVYRDQKTEEMLQSAINVFPEKVVGNCEKVDEAVQLSKDVARYVYALYLLHVGNREYSQSMITEANQLMQQIADSGRYGYENSVVLGYKGSTIISYYDVKR